VHWVNGDLPAAVLAVRSRGGRSSPKQSSLADSADVARRGTGWGREAKVDQL